MVYIDAFAKELMKLETKAEEIKVPKTKKENKW